MEQVATHPLLLEKVLLVLHYFEVFSYPLTRQEIRSNCSILLSPEETEATLRELEERKKAFAYKGYYSSHASVKNWVERRLAGNCLADRHIQKAVVVGRFLYGFPFVRFVGISGSLSKGFSRPKGDYDFFIVTEKNRLWICRTILHFFKKMSFLAGQQHKFCMNYFLDEAHQEIEEKNLYTAIELSTLLPVSGSQVYRQLMQENNWVKDFLPNDYIPFYSIRTSDRKARFFRWLELPFTIYGNALNRMLMKLTDRKWRRKWEKKNYPKEDYDLAFKTTLYQSKNHPTNYQKKTLEGLKTIVHNKGL